MKQLYSIIYLLRFYWDDRIRKNARDSYETVIERKNQLKMLKIKFSGL